MKILLTGIAGFIGSRVAQMLAQRLPCGTISCPRRLRNQRPLRWPPCRTQVLRHGSSN